MAEVKGQDLPMKHLFWMLLDEDLKVKFDCQRFLAQGKLLQPVKEEGIR